MSTEADHRPVGSILDAYVSDAPSAQNAVDIFAGEWSSRFPDVCGVQAGAAELFDDARITWLGQVIGGLGRKRVLELGPLEGGHTRMLAEAGADVTAVEANTRAYLKCLVAKEIVGMPRAKFLLGDFIEYLRTTSERFDVCVASGVLYHMRDPIELLELIGGVADRLLLWTHYFDQDRYAQDPVFAGKFSEHADHVRAGFAYQLHRFEYYEALAWEGFCGGSARHAQWLSRADLYRALEHLGWQVDAVEFDHPDHPNAPAIAVVAHRAADASLELAPTDVAGARRERTMCRIDVTRGPGLEIGPLCTPIVSRSSADVKYLDVFDTAMLKQHYGPDPAVDTDAIVDVDFPLLQDGELRSMAAAVGESGPFAWAVASHVVEHVPDLIEFLSELGTLVEPDGMLALAVPDRRFCFDALRPATTVGELLLAHEQRDRRPSLRAVFDHFSDCVRTDPRQLWLGITPSDDQRMHSLAEVTALVERYRTSDDYIDAHVWLFTPESFVAQLRTLAELGMIEFTVDHLIPTAPNDIEFFVTLRRIPDGLTSDERAARLASGFAEVGDGFSR